MTMTVALGLDSFCGFLIGHYEQWTLFSLVIASQNRTRSALKKQTSRAGKWRLQRSGGRRYTFLERKKKLLQILYSFTQLLNQTMFQGSLWNVGSREQLYSCSFSRRCLLRKVIAQTNILEYLCYKFTNIDQVDF